MSIRLLPRAIAKKDVSLKTTEHTHPTFTVGKKKL
jgi:hypothetical protein